MKKFYQIIVNNPKKIIVCFLLSAMVSVVLSGMVEVNYDITGLPPRGHSFYRFPGRPGRGI